MISHRIGGRRSSRILIPLFVLALISRLGLLTSFAAIPLADQNSAAGAATFVSRAAGQGFAEAAYYQGQGFHVVASWQPGDTLSTGDDATSWQLLLGGRASATTSVDLQLSHALGWAQVTDDTGAELWWAHPSASVESLNATPSPLTFRMELFRSGRELAYADNPNGVEYNDAPFADMAFNAMGGAIKEITPTLASASSTGGASTESSGLRYNGSGLSPRPWDQIRVTVSTLDGSPLPAGARFRIALDGGLVDVADRDGSQRAFYVSPEGSDSSAGTQVAPFASPARALAAARAARLVAGGEGVASLEIWLADGRYPMPSGLQLDAADSGSSKAPLCFKALPGAEPVLFGGRSLDTSEFTKISNNELRARLIDPTARDAVLALPLGPGADLGQISRHGWLFKYEWGLREMPEPVLVIGGRTMQLARWPNAGEPDLVVESIVDPGPDRDSDEFWERGGTFINTAFAARSGKWSDTSDLWLSGTFGEAWAWSYNKVANIERGNSRVTLAHAEVDGIRGNDWTRSFFHAENLFEELDAPGEYYIDRASRTLFLYPPEGFDAGSEVYLTALDQPMIVARGADHLCFEGITFEGGRTHGLVFEDCRNITIHRCTVRGFSDDAITFAGGQDNIATACRVEEIGSSGFVLTGGDLDTLEPSRHRIVNSTVTRNGTWDRAWRPAVSLSGVGHEVRHCLLEDIPHMAIDVNGNDHRIEYNEICDAVQLLDDMCAIYFNTGEEITQRGTLIRRNHFRDIALDGTHSRGAIYLDNMTMGVEICENIFERIGNSAKHWTIMNHGGADNRVERNTFIDCPLPLYVGFPLTSYFAQHADFYLSSWQQSYTVTAGFTDTVFGTRYPELKSFFDTDPKLPDTNTFRDNTLLCPNIHPVSASGFLVGDGAPASLIDSAGNLTDPEGFTLADNFVHIGLLGSEESVAPRDWLISQFGTGTGDWDADPDLDGLPNALEFALGHDPNTADAPSRPWVEHCRGEDGCTELHARLDPRAALCCLQPETTTDLGSWTADGRMSQLPSETDGHVAFRTAGQAADREFYRLVLRIFE